MVEWVHIKILNKKVVFFFFKLSKIVYIWVKPVLSVSWKFVKMRISLIIINRKRVQHFWRTNSSFKLWKFNFVLDNRRAIQQISWGIVLEEKFSNFIIFYIRWNFWFFFYKIWKMVQVNVIELEEDIFVVRSSYSVQCFSFLSNQIKFNYKQLQLYPCGTATSF